MAQSGYTPISFYYSTTAAATPSASNLVNGEIAINTADGVIYYKNTGGTVVPLSFGTAAVSWQSVQASNFAAVAGKGYPVNTTSAGVTATLPASPTAGQAVGFVDYAGTFATYNLTINPNGSKILGATGNVIVTTNRESLLFVYIDSTKGWLPYAGFLGSNPAPATYAASYLIVAGGGGSPIGSGGGAGGLLTGTSTLTLGTVYSVTVGAGGAGAVNVAASSGADSTALGLTAVGGGFGGYYTTSGNGGSGGSGGGAGSAGSSYTGGTGTTGQGNNGGNNSSASPYPGGGGGGAGAAGGTGSGSTGGSGGVGLSNSITGSAVFYAGGGGAGGTTQGSSAGTGGNGGGGNGSSSGNGNNGTTNTGGGGGGSYNSGFNTGGSGGSGVVILSVPTANYSGTTTGSPTVTTSGSNTIIKFTASGSYTA